MALPKFVSTRHYPIKTSPSDPSRDDGPSRTPTTSYVKRATRTRYHWSLVTSFLFFIALIFIILVEVSNISPTLPVVNTIFFLKLDLSHVIPNSVPNALLINSIARTLGLHDFYQVGLWNFCEGYNSDPDAITACSKPQTLYWFNPVEILLNELLSGASIALPSNIVSALTLIRLASHWMFALFLTSAGTSTVSIFLAPFSLYTRWLTLPIAVFTFLSALFTTAASVIATAMFIIFRNVVKGAAQDVNIDAEVGVKMFAFMWAASACSVLGWLVQMGMCCCCASRRDVRRGRKGRSRMVEGGGAQGVEEKKGARRRWGRKAR